MGLVSEVTKPMRIALIYLGRRGSGGPISLELATQLTVRASVLAVLSSQSESLAAWKSLAVEQQVVEAYSRVLEAGLEWISRQRVKAIATQIRVWQPDVLLFPMFYTWNPMIQEFLSDIPSVVIVHDPLPHPTLSSLVFHQIQRLSIRKATRCLVLSQPFVETLVKMGTPRSQIDVIPHGPLNYYHQRKNLIQSSEKAQPAQIPKVLFFGKITAYKGLEVLLEAIQIVQKSQPVKLVIAGQGGLKPYSATLKKIREIEIYNHWISEQEIADFFNKRILVALPYTSASQSGVIALAAAFGCPVIASRVGGIPEQISDGKTGLLVEPGSPPKLAQAILRLIYEPTLAADLGTNLKNEYARIKNWEEISKIVIQSCELAQMSFNGSI